MYESQMDEHQISELRKNLPLKSERRRTGWKKRIWKKTIWKKFVAAMLQPNIKDGRILRWSRIRALISDGFMPEDYFEYRMFSNEMFERRKDFLTPRQLIPILQREQNPELALIFDDKTNFYDWCISHEIPTVKNLGLIKNDDPGLPHQLEGSFFVKPVDGVCGRGAIRVVSQGDQWKWPGRPPMQWAELKSQLISHSQMYGDLLIQNCLQNHRSIQDLTGDTLATVRVVTLQQQIGKPEILLAALRCSTGNLSVDNFAQGGLVVAIDEATGQLLGNAASKQYSPSPWLDHHPITNVSLSGLVIPEWPLVKTLALQAHQACKNMSQPTVGWDIALCPSGPLVIEANTIWCPSVVQLAHQRGLLTTKYGSFLKKKYHRSPDQSTSKSLNSCVN